MTSVQVGPGEIEDGDSSFTGTWWLPGTDTRTGGTLKFSRSEGARLELHGSLHSDPFNAPEPLTVFGQTIEHGRVTLTRAFIQSHMGNAIGPLLDPAEAVQQIWWSPEVFIGEHFPQGEATQFDVIGTYSLLLPDWAGKPRPSVDRQGALQIVTIDVPANLEARLPGGKVVLEWSGRATYGLDTEIVVRPRFTYFPDRAVTLDHVRRTVFDPLIMLTTLATLHPDRAHGHFVVQKSGESYLTADVLSQNTFALRKTSRPIYYECLVPFSAVEERFSDLVPLWFELFSHSEVAFQEFFADIWASNSFLEEQFGRIIRSVEKWHRDTVGGEFMRQAEFNALMTEVTKAAKTGPEREFLRMRLRYANELTLKQRLDDLLHMAGPRMEHHVGQHFPKFTKISKDLRNDLVHGSTSLNLNQMYAITRVMRTIFFLVLLQKLGFPEDECWDRLQTSRQTEELFALGEEWLRRASA